MMFYHLFTYFRQSWSDNPSFLFSSSSVFPGILLFFSLALFSYSSQGIFCIHVLLGFQQHLGHCLRRTLYEGDYKLLGLQPSFKGGYLHLVISFVNLWYIFGKTFHVRSRGFSFSLPNGDQVIHQPLLTLSINKVAHERIAQLFKVVNGQGCQFSEPHSHFFFQGGRKRAT